MQDNLMQEILLSLASFDGIYKFIFQLQDDKNYWPLQYCYVSWIINMYSIVS